MSGTPVPPRQLAVPATAHAVVLAGSALALALLVVLALRAWERDRSPVFLACLIGGGLCTVLEPFWDVLGLVYFRERGAPVLFTVAGRGMPVWVYLAYHVYAGLSAYWFFRLFAGGATMARFWQVLGAVFCLNLFIEIPVTALSVYDYYGAQPFNLTGFPLWWLFTNVGGGIVSGAVLARGGSLFAGRRALAAILLVPSAFGAWEIFAGWPTFAALSSGAGFGLTYPAALVTIAIAVTTASLIARAACHRPAPEAVGVRR
ncbi:MAG: hypothetical protein LC792_16315 [Actinobacteria bacterium]|nr:hypothetical protein [Actinomycetota bacterium]